jgi:chlorobactene glucosyltransferase
LQENGNIRTKVSILIPARNEEKVIERVVTAALEQDWPHTEVIVLNDNSDDATGSILQGLSEASGGRLTVIDGKQRPQGWLGKPWACQQLGEAASGNILAFIDADTTPNKNLASSLVTDFATKGGALTTVWPRQQLVTTSEKIVVPLVYFTLLSFLVTDYTQRDPRWMPSFLRKRLRPLFAAACGQCIAMPAHLYRDIGGHSIVKSDVVEDVGIARAVRSLGVPVRMYHGIDSISCRMYTGHEEIFQGFRKNFLAGFGGNVTVFLMSAVFHLVIFVLPPVALVASLINEQYDLSLLRFAATLIPITQRMMLNRWMQWDLWTAVTHVVGVLWFQYLGLVVVADRLLGRKAIWKGRKVE